MVLGIGLALPYLTPRRFKGGTLARRAALPAAALALIMASAALAMAFRADDASLDRFDASLDRFDAFRDVYRRRLPMMPLPSADDSRS
jgi:hypothetical protein